MACNWLMMTSSGDNNGRVGVWVCLPTKLKIPKAEQETAQPTAARSIKTKPKAKHDRARLRLCGNKTAVRFKPRCKAHGYSHCPTALLLLFLSLCERSAHET